MSSKGKFARSATWTSGHYIDESDIDDLSPSSSGVDDTEDDDTLRRWRQEAEKKRSMNGRPKMSEMQWVKALKGYLGREEPHYSEEAAERAVQAHLRQLLDTQDQGQESTSGATGAIPPFFKARPAEDSLAGQVKRLARTRFLRKQHDALLDPEELSIVWGGLKESISGPDDDPAKDRINYDDFCQVGERSVDQIGPKVKPFFAPSVFLTFEADQYGRIGIYPFYLYMMRMTSLTQARIDMCVFDEDGDGYLKHTELEAYIGQLIPSLPQLGSSDVGPGGAFVNMYKKISARKFFFFIDLHKRNKLLIRDVLLHPVLSELMELRQDDPEEVSPANWFLLDNARRVYTLFCKLDRDRNGTLSKQELLAWNDGGLTPIFVDRVFDEHVRRSRLGRGHPREMDVASFVDFVLAMDYKNTPEALGYLFRCLDIRGQGFLTAADIYTLFKAVHQKWMEADNYELVIEDVKDEIWDMVKPADPLRITLADLVACKQGDTVVSMLTDVRGFWQHDNRETLAQQQEEEDAAQF